MRKHIVLALLVPILALTLISCDPSMRTSFANFLGGLGGNVYSDLVKPDYSGVEEANTIIQNLESDTIPADDDGIVKPSTFGIKVEIDVGDGGSLTTLGVQKKDDQDALKDALKNATNTDDKKEKFAEDQKKPASTTQQQAASGTVQVINATIDALKDAGDTPDVVKDLLDAFTLPDLDDDDVEELTQADVLVLQLMTDMISNVLDAVDADGSFKDGVDPQSLLNDALFAIDIAETLSGASTIDFSAKISLSSLIPKSDDGSSSLAMVPIDDENGILHGLRGLFPHIISLMGIKKTGDTYTYNSTTYKQFIINQRACRASWEQAVQIAGDTYNIKGKTRFSEDTLIKYALAVLVTENHEFLKSIPAGPGNEVIAAFLNENPRFGDAPTNSNKITSFEDGAVGDIYSEDHLDAFFGAMGKAKFKRIILTAQTINDNIDERYRVEPLVQELEKIMEKLDDNSTTDENWFNIVFGDEKD